MHPDEIKEALSTADPSFGQQLPEWEDNPAALVSALVGMLDEWQQGNTEALIERYCTSDESLCGVAALALGDLQSAYALAARRSEKSAGKRSDNTRAENLLEMLENEFLIPGKPESVGWALVEALSLSGMDARTVRKTIEPVLVQKSLTPEQKWYVAYLIGEIRLQPKRYPIGHDSLCMWVCSQGDDKLRSIAVDALAALRDTGDEALFRQIALTGLSTPGAPSGDLGMLVRRKALEALANVGTLETVRQLRIAGVDRKPELSATFYRVSREIYWRSNAITCR
jgi:hypothetical protein